MFSTDFGGVEGKIEMQAVEAAASKMEVQDVDEKSDSDNESKGYCKIALFWDSDFFLNQLKDFLHLSTFANFSKAFHFPLEHIGIAFNKISVNCNNNNNDSNNKNNDNNRFH